VLHVCVSFAPQLCIVLGSQTPPPVQADQLLQVPVLSHVRVWVPSEQYPQACVVGPLQAHCPPAQLALLAHALPQPPQLLLSLCSATQLLAQSV
jgi:hypothetical protein